jgi:hypothetical protein
MPATDVLEGEWPPIEEYSPDFTPSYTAPQAHRGPSVTNLNVSPSGGKYVWLLYVAVVLSRKGRVKA